MSLPVYRPVRPTFGSGPCAKPPGWSADQLAPALVGRSHRSREGLAQIQQLLAETRALLNIPAEYHLALLPGSDTGAFEAALWNFLGPRPVDVLAWDVFGHNWGQAITQQLRLPQTRVIEASFGHLPDLQQVDFMHDVVFAWNGTTTGGAVPDGNWIDPARQGLTICDGISAVFTIPLPWERLDVTSFSWQKALGGEAAHGMLVLSPRAVERLKAHQPSWPMPRLYNLRGEGGWNALLFEGHTLNTPSMLCVADCLLALKWMHDQGGLPAMIARAQKNADLLYDWIADTPWAAPLVVEKAHRAPTPVCFQVRGREESTSLSQEWEVIKAMAAFLEAEAAAFDIKNHARSLPSLRIWTGPTVEHTDLMALLPWLEAAYEHINR